MREYLELSPNPVDEKCVQTGEENYASRQRKECQIFIAQLRRQFGEEPFGAYFKVKGNPHDFGTYYEVAIYYDDNEEAAAEYAYDVENNLPEKWDEQSLAEIKKCNLYNPTEFSLSL